MQTPFPEHWFSAYVDGELSDAEREQVERALAEQPEYRQLVDELTAMRSALRRLPRESFEGDVRQRVLQRAERAMFEPGSIAAAKVQPKQTSSNHEPAPAAASGSSRRFRTRLIAVLLATSAALLLAFVAYFPQTARQTIAVHELAEEAAAPEQMAAQREERAGRPRLQPGDHDVAGVDEVREDVPPDAQRIDGRAPMEDPLEREALGRAPAAGVDEYVYGDSASAVAESRYRSRLYELEEAQLLREDVATRGLRQRDDGLMFGSVDDYGPLARQPYDAILYVTLHPEATDRKIIQEALATLSPVATDDAEGDAPAAQVSEADAARPAHPPSDSWEFDDQLPDSEEAATPSIKSHRLDRLGAGEQEPLRELHLRLASHEQLQEAVERLRSLKPVLEVHLTPSQPSLGGGFGYFPSERMEQFGLGGMGGYGLGGMDSVGAPIRGREAETESESPMPSAESPAIPEELYQKPSPIRDRLQEGQRVGRRLARPEPAVPALSEPEPAESEPDVPLADMLEAARVPAERVLAEPAEAEAGPEAESDVAEDAEWDDGDEAEARRQRERQRPARAGGRRGRSELQPGLSVQPGAMPPEAADAAPVDAVVEEEPVPKVLPMLGATEFFYDTLGPQPPGAAQAAPYQLPADSEERRLRILIVVQPGESEREK